MMTESQIGSSSRRAFLRDGSLLLLGAAFGSCVDASLAGEAKRRVRVGMVTDLHYADKPPARSRYYREALAKLAEAAGQFHKDQPDFVTCLGDLIDSADSVKAERGFLTRINKDFAALPGKKHYVLGNHCVDTLTKDEFLEEVGQKKSYYSFDVAGFHFVVLDACFRRDGQPYGRKNADWSDTNIPADEVEWLAADLKEAKGKAVVFVHQRLDVTNHFGVRNAKDVRKVLEDSGKVLAVFQGHSHQNDLTDVGGIHYCTLVAMVEGSGKENSGYCTMDVLENGAIRLTGFRRQKNYEWS
jgi:predicted phosphodiesterase